MEQYKIALISGEKEFQIIEAPVLEPNDNQVLVKLEACAICTLEQRVYAGTMKRYPFAGGHEMAGTVVKVGKNVKGVKPGDKVAPRMLTSCGECHYCRNGHENQCVISFQAETHPGFNGPGGFAEYMMVGKEAVYKLSPDIDLAKGALTEPLACCVHSINNANIQLGDDVVIIGVGIMGAFHIQLAKMKGARVIACEADPGRMEMARKLGADIVLDTSADDGIEKVKELTEGKGADAVICTVANSQLAENSIKMTGKNGRVVFYSSFHPDTPIGVSPNSIHYSEMILTGSVNPSKQDFLMASRLLSFGLIDVSLLISGKYPLADIEKAMDHALKPDSYRIILEL